MTRQGILSHERSSEPYSSWLRCVIPRPRPRPPPTVDESSFVETPRIQSKHTVPEVATPSSRFDWRAHITREGGGAGHGHGMGSRREGHPRRVMTGGPWDSSVTPRRRIDRSRGLIDDEDDDRVVRRPGGARDGDDGEREIGVRGDVR